MAGDAHFVFIRDGYYALEEVSDPLPRRIGINVPGACQVLLDTFRQVLTKFSDFLHVTGTGLLIQTSLGSWGDLGALRTKRSG